MSALSSKAGYKPSDEDFAKLLNSPEVIALFHKLKSSEPAGPPKQTTTTGKSQQERQQTRQEAAPAAAPAAKESAPKPGLRIKLPERLQQLPIKVPSKDAYPGPPKGNSSATTKTAKAQDAVQGPGCTTGQVGSRQGPQQQQKAASNKEETATEDKRKASTKLQEPAPKKLKADTPAAAPDAASVSEEQLSFGETPKEQEEPLSQEALAVFNEETDNIFNEHAHAHQQLLQEQQELNSCVTPGRTFEHTYSELKTIQKEFDDYIVKSEKKLNTFLSRYDSLRTFHANLLVKSDKLETDNKQLKADKNYLKIENNKLKAEGVELCAHQSEQLHAYQEEIKTLKTDKRKAIDSSTRAARKHHDNEQLLKDQVSSALTSLGREVRKLEEALDIKSGNRANRYKPYFFFPWVKRETVQKYEEFKHASKPGYYDSAHLSAAVDAGIAY